jgi:cyclopropane fatty-acyl-phospholipid synthase-like methyltransferase
VIPHSTLRKRASEIHSKGVYRWIDPTIPPAILPQEACDFLREIHLLVLAALQLHLHYGRSAEAVRERIQQIFADKMRRLTAQLDEQFTESARLEAEIRKNMQRLGFEVKI